MLRKERRELTNVGKGYAIFLVVMMIGLIVGWFDKGMDDRLVFFITVCTGIIIGFMALARLDDKGKLYKETDWANVAKERRNDVKKSSL